MLIQKIESYIIVEVLILKALVQNREAFRIRGVEMFYQPCFHGEKVTTVNQVVPRSRFFFNFRQYFKTFRNKLLIFNNFLKITKNLVSVLKLKV